VKIRHARGQLVFDFWLQIHDNHRTFVHEKPHAVACNNGMGARQLGRVRPNGVIASPILPDRPLSGKGPSMSIVDTTVANVASPAPSSDPTEVRRQRGLAIAAVTRVVRIKGCDDRWVVPSQTGQKKYTVNLLGASPACDCDDFVKRGLPCKHIFAVEFTKAREANSEPRDAPQVQVSVVKLATNRAPEETVAPRKTYKQDWPAYNTAQIHEKERFLGLLHELCAGVPSPAANPKGGCTPVPMADRAFACAFKVYTTISGRRASTDMRDARDKGHLSRAPHYSGVSRYMEDPAMTPILRGLIAESALPLRSIEVDFAVDSSGFTSTRFIRWFDHKYGVVKRQYDWVKVSVMTGRTTNVITAVEIDERYSADCPKFARLLESTVGNGFKLGEVSADTAYMSYDNMELVATHGGTPYIAFKCNATADRGGTMARMFHLFNFNRDDYLNHYHKRSNVESTFSMMKAKFGDSLRSKSDTAMVNEALCKVLCHNLCCLISSIYELGVEATFWQAEPEPIVDDLPADCHEDADLWAWV
jgi:transposase